MAVQLLRCDEHGHIRHSFDSSLIKGSRVAVIDLRVFVPEVVPVLSACADQRLPRHLDAIPFSKQLIGKGKTLPAFPPSLAEDPVENAIAQAIKSSDIELVQRLSPPVRNQLVADISRLARKANLYGTQLDAFAQALQASIHCTQGPPGTGKVRPSVARQPVSVAAGLVRWAGLLG